MATLRGSQRYITGLKIYASRYLEVTNVEEVAVFGAQLCARVLRLLADFAIWCLCVPLKSFRATEPSFCSYLQTKSLARLGVASPDSSLLKTVRAPRLAHSVFCCVHFVLCPPEPHIVKYPPCVYAFAVGGWRAVGGAGVREREGRGAPLRSPEVCARRP